MAKKSKDRDPLLTARGTPRARKFPNQADLPVFGKSKPGQEDLQPPSGPDAGLLKKLEKLRRRLLKVYLPAPGSRPGNRNAEGLLDRGNIHALGIGRKYEGGKPTGKWAVTVYVEEKREESGVCPTALIKLPGGTTDVIQSPPFRFCSSDQFLNPGETVRNSQGGLFGTMTCVAMGQQNQVLILSASHVLCPPGAAVDNLIDFILPSSDNLSRPVGRLAGPIDPPLPGQTRRFDAAIARVNGSSVNVRYDDGNSIVSSIATGTGSMPVKKTGRHGTTFGWIEGISKAINIPLPGGSVQFVEQYIVRSHGIFAQSGDSGSLVVTLNNEPVGMVVAAIDNLTVVTPINTILSALNIQLLV